MAIIRIIFLNVSNKEDKNSFGLKKSLLKEKYKFIKVHNLLYKREYILSPAEKLVHFPECADVAMLYTASINFKFITFILFK